MEILLFAILAVFRLYSPRKNRVLEPDRFEPFDVQTLNQVYHSKVESSRRSSGRQESYAIRAVS